MIKNDKVGIGIVVLLLALLAGIFLKPEMDTLAVEQLDDTSDQVDEEYVLEIGNIAPFIQLEDLSGQNVSLEDYKGQIVLVNFWATWCKFCDKEMPDLEKLHLNYDNLTVLAVNVKESKDHVKSYIEEGGYTFPVLLDENGEVTNRYQVTAFPTSYFIDEEGKLIGSIQGMMTYAQMESVLERIIKGEI